MAHLLSRPRNRCRSSASTVSPVRTNDVHADRVLDQDAFPPSTCVRFTVDVRARRARSSSTSRLGSVGEQPTRIGVCCRCSCSSKCSRISPSEYRRSAGPRYARVLDVGRRAELLVELGEKERDHRAREDALGVRGHHDGRLPFEDFVRELAAVPVLERKRREARLYESHHQNRAKK